jgi:ketosteroid isomerase-like protein
MNATPLLRHGGTFVLAATLLATTAARASEEAARLRTLELDLNRAIVARDAHRVSDLVSDDWILINGAAKIKTKADLLDELALPEMEFQQIDARDVMVRVWGDTAVVTGTLHQRYRLRGRQTELTLRYTDTWARTGDSWRQVSVHMTRLPD